MTNKTSPKTRMMNIPTNSNAGFTSYTLTLYSTKVKVKVRVLWGDVVYYEAELY